MFPWKGTHQFRGFISAAEKLFYHTITSSWCEGVFSSAFPLLQSMSLQSMLHSAILALWLCVVFVAVMRRVWCRPLPLSCRWSSFQLLEIEPLFYQLSCVRTVSVAFTKKQFTFGAWMRQLLGSEILPPVGTVATHHYWRMCSYIYYFGPLYPLKVTSVVLLN